MLQLLSRINISLLIFTLFCCNYYGQYQINPKDELSKITFPPNEFSMDSFYKKYINANGIHRTSSAKLPDAAILAVYKTIKFMTDFLTSEVLHQMIGKNTRIAVMARYEGTTDIPEHAYIANYITLNWDVRARGLGGPIELPLTTCAEENVSCYHIDKYHAEDILIHEFAHTIHDVGILPNDTSFNTFLQKQINTAIAEGKYKNTYAIAYIYEYLAEGVQSWFNVNAEVSKPDGKHNQVNTRKELKEYDLGLYLILKDFFLNQMNVLHLIKD